MYDNYFKNHSVSYEIYENFKIPDYVKRELPADKNAAILDIGCGLGQFLEALKKEDYGDLTGIDISDEAVEAGAARKNNVIKITGIKSFCMQATRRYDFIIMSHVIEHIEKDEIIETIKLIRENLMKPGAVLYAAVPNAQSNTGCYWAYEDFTHTTLFTAESLIFVMKLAGFGDIKFLDRLGLANTRPAFKIFKKALIKLYELNNNFWNRILASSYHEQSPRIYTFDLKCIVKNI